jgi:purine-binding chemotaxis protein CheW
MKDKHASSGVDWGEVRRRLDAAREKLEQGFSPGSAERTRILAARAKALAAEPSRDEAGEKIEIVEFLLAYERYGIETSYVHEVHPLKDLTPVPCTPAFVLGIINVRGRILSIVDLKKFFDLPEKGLGELNKVIILRSDSMEFGVLADAIVGVRALPLAGLQAAIPTLTGVREEYLKGITKDRVAVLDAGKILADKRIIVDDQA